MLNDILLKHISKQDNPDLCFNDYLKKILDRTSIEDFDNILDKLLIITRGDWLRTLETFFTRFQIIEESLHWMNETNWNIIQFTQNQITKMILSCNKQNLHRLIEILLENNQENLTLQHVEMVFFAIEPFHNETKMPDSLTKFWNLIKNSFPQAESIFLLLLNSNKFHHYY